MRALKFRGESIDAPLKNIAFQAFENTVDSFRVRWWHFCTLGLRDTAHLQVSIHSIKERIRQNSNTGLSRFIAKDPRFHKIASVDSGLCLSPSI